MGVHDGHRERLRERFIKHGLDNFNELNSLELLLFYAIPRRDTNTIAHKLIDKFGSMTAVFEASQQELMEIEGIGENAASLIRLVPQIVKRAAVTKADRISCIKDIHDAAAYLWPRFMNEADEIFLMICLDHKMNVISCHELSRGVSNTVSITIRQALEIALKSKCHYVIVSHNHPDESCAFSIEDEIATKKLFSSLYSAGVELYDHILFTGDDYCSFRNLGLLDLYRNSFM